MNDELFILIQRHLDDDLTADETVALNDQLRRDIAARRHLVHFMQLAQLHRESFNPPQTPQASAVASQQPRWSRRLSALLAAALIGLVASVWWFVNVPNTALDSAASDGNTPVAMLTNTQGAVITSRRQPIKLGDDLAAGPIELTSGRAQVMFGSGAVVDLVAPCRFEMITAKKGRLDFGTLDVYVPEQAHGFTVNAPGMRLVDLGTRFSVAVHQGEESEMRVTEGLVLVELLDADDNVRESFQLSAGQGASYDATRRSVHQFKAFPQNAAAVDTLGDSRIEKAFQYGRDGYDGSVDVVIARDAPGAAEFIVESKAQEPRLRRVIDAWGSPLPPSYETTMHTVDNQDSWRIGLLKFDGIFDDIPTNAKIVSARLRLHVINPWEAMAVWRVLTPWDADTANWNYFDGDGSGSDQNDHPSEGGGLSPGINISLNPVYSGPLGLGDQELDVTQVVQQWRLKPSSNHGFGFTQLHNGNRGQFVANDDEAIDQRPKLTIMYKLTKP
ncbi:DNRLRE domain-containing protein [Planctomycetales bacterium ZRK34]|nr:DNRLRE domain-containing protein [Planctomycetales bacterium ZRK34]